MGYLEEGCPFCHRALNDYVNSESYAGKWISIDVPVDILVHGAVEAKEFLYRSCKKWNETTKGNVKFNLESLR